MPSLFDPPGLPYPDFDSDFGPTPIPTPAPIPTCRRTRPASPPNPLAARNLAVKKPAAQLAVPSNSTPPLTPLLSSP